MQLTTTAIITSALNILHEYGLGDLTIRRLARTLDVAPAALYWHFPNKQALLGGVADELLSPLDDLKEQLLKSVDDEEGSRDSDLSPISHDVPATTSQPPRPQWYRHAYIFCAGFYRQCICCRDAADLISAALPAGMVTNDPIAALSQILRSSLPDGDEDAILDGSTTLISFILGLAIREQTAAEASKIVASSVFTADDGHSGNSDAPSQTDDDASSSASSYPRAFEWDELLSQHTGEVDAWRALLSASANAGLRIILDGIAQSHAGKSWFVHPPR
ncbi:TetR/AcrR family transcriptional regulator [Corynebacterium sp.]|uniref:TetR/AcrR family transcriptional regulator n=1 Tax=Corynebacterium sp. TaxID=1720 RepID=UPI0026DAB551|nr:TetR/AcrR family transcriptional regulator [Corynebacterium sp.]MDO4914056.1 TetR/AcrR family transcriptional regulator [Corynebacterium sp.]